LSQVQKLEAEVKDLVAQYKGVELGWNNGGLEITL